MLKLSLVAPKFRLRRVNKRGKKEQKMKNCVLQKNRSPGTSAQTYGLGMGSDFVWYTLTKLKISILWVCSPYNGQYVAKTVKNSKKLRKLGRNRSKIDVQVSVRGLMALVWGQTWFGTLPRR